MEIELRFLASSAVASALNHGPGSSLNSTPQVMRTTLTPLHMSLDESSASMFPRVKNVAPTAIQTEPDTIVGMERVLHVRKMILVYLWKEGLRALLVIDAPIVKTLSQQLDERL